MNDLSSNIRKPRASILAAAVAPAALLLLGLPAPSWGDAIFAPTDLIRGGEHDLGLNLFTIGTGAGLNNGTNNWPAGESPDHAIDGVSQKYLNFGETFTGFLVQPSFNGGNGAIPTSMQLWTANDGVERDPASYQLWGTNTALDFGMASFDMSAFTPIASGSLSLPVDRNGGGLTALQASRSQTVTFPNLDGYKSFLVIFPTVKNEATANSMQIAEVQLFGIASFTSLTWTGTISNIWNINTAANWSVGGTSSTYSDTNGVTFDDTGAPAQTNIIVQAGGTGVKPAAVLFQNNGLSYTISGEPIISPGTLTLNGAATVTLNNSNSYSVGTTINAGTLIVGATGSLGSNPLVVNNINVGQGSAVNVTFNSPQTIGSLSGTIATPSAGVNTATVTVGGTLTVDQAANGTFEGNITGAGGLMKLGAGILTLTAANTYAGPTTILSGTLNSRKLGDTPESALPPGQPVVVNAGATLLFGADDGAGYYEGSVSSITVNGGTIRGGANTHSTLPALTLSGATISAVDAGNIAANVRTNYILDGNVTTVAGAAPTTFSAPNILLRKDPTNTGISNPVTFNVPRGTAAVDLDIQSVILDQGAGFIKTGDGILSLAHASAFTGPANISAGKVIVGNSNALGLGTVTLGNGTVLAMQAPPSLSGFGGFSLNGGATVDGTSSVLTLTEDVGNLSRSAFFPTRLGFASGFTANFVYTAGGTRAADGITFTIQNNSPTIIGGGGGGLGYVGIPNSASLQFNIYTGAGQPTGTNVAAGTTGTYLSTSPVNIASGNPILVNVVYDPAAQTVSETLTDTITNDTYNIVFPNIDLPSFIGANSGFVGFTGATGGAVALQTVGNFNYGSTLPGINLPNAIQIPANSAAGIELQPNPNGGLAIGKVDGTLDIGLDGTLNVTGGAALTNTPYELTLGGSVALSGNAIINVVNNGTGLGKVIAAEPVGQVSPATLTKVGNGTLVIAGTSTYAGVTTVSGGTLVVNGALSGAATTVNSTATLAGTGTVTGVVIAGGATIAPGDGGIGTLTTGPLALQGGSTFALEIGNATADQVKVNGAGTLTGTIAFSLTLTADPTDFQAFTILDGTGPLVGYATGARFSYLGVNLAEGQLFTVSSGAFSQEFMISYAADSNRDVVLTAVPEPATAMSLIVGLGTALSLRRRRARA